MLLLNIIPCISNIHNRWLRFYHARNKLILRFTFKSEVKINVIKICKIDQELVEGSHLILYFYISLKKRTLFKFYNFITF